MWATAVRTFALFAAATTPSRTDWTPPLDQPVVTVWLIPFEPVGKRWNRPMTTSAAQRAISEFERRYGNGRPVTLLDVTLPTLRENLSGWHPEYGSLTWATILSQTSTLDALERFATENGVHVRARFLPWGRMLPELQQALASREDVPLEIPDVAQVGSTWTPFFATRSAAFPDAAGAALRWRDIPSAARSALMYTKDVRLLLYHRQLPWDEASSTCNLTTKDWNVLLSSLSACNESGGSRVGPPLAMPLGLSYNLIHDLLPAMGEGQHSLFSDHWPNRIRVELTSDSALRVPLLLAVRGTVGGRQQVTWPELTNNEALPHFVDGEYRGLIVPLVFLKLWHEASRRTGQSPKEFWDQAGVAVPPTSARGGSDLMVFGAPERVQLAWRLSRYLATDRKQTARLAELGQLPAQMADGGIARFLESLDIPDSATVLSLRATIAEAESKGVEHPLYAWWTTRMEDLVVLESLQRFGRSIALGNMDGNAERRLRSAARTLEAALNQQLDPWEEYWGIVHRWWPGGSAVLVLVAAVMLWQGRQVRQRQRGQLLALLLVRGKHHSALHLSGLALQNMAREEAPEGLGFRLENYGRSISTVYNPQIDWIGRGVRAEIAGANAPIDLMTVVRNGHQAAVGEFRMAWDREPPSLPLMISPEVQGCAPSRGSHILAMVIQEWLYNSFKECIRCEATGRQLQAPEIHVSVSGARAHTALRITTPAPIPQHQKERLTAPATTLQDLQQVWLESTRCRASGADALKANADDQRSGTWGWGSKTRDMLRSGRAIAIRARDHEPRGAEGEGLGLIRDLLHYGLGAKARIEGDGPVILVIELNAANLDRMHNVTA